MSCCWHSIILWLDHECHLAKSEFPKFPDVRAFILALSWILVSHRLQNLSNFPHLGLCSQNQGTWKQRKRLRPCHASRTSFYPIAARLLFHRMSPSKKTLGMWGIFCPSLSGQIDLTESQQMLDDETSGGRTLLSHALWHECQYLCCLLFSDLGYQIVCMSQNILDRLTINSASSTGA